MKGKMLIPAALFALLLAPLASPALAGRDRRAADRPPRLAELAYELHDATRHLRAEALKRARVQRRGPYGYHRGPSVVGPGTVQALTQLERESYRFLRSVESRSPRRIDRELFRLTAAVDRASYKVNRARSKHLREDFRDVTRLVQRVSRRVELARGPGKVRPGNGSHGSVVIGKRGGRGGFSAVLNW